jgi:hypothetical protein
MEKRILLLPFLFATAPIVALFSNNMGQARPAETLVPIAVVVAATLVLFPLLAWLMRGYVRAAVVMSLGWFVFFGYGHVAEAIGTHAAGGTSFANPKLMFPGMFLLLGVIAWLVRRTAGPPLRFAAVLMVVALAIFLTSTLSIVRFYAAGGTIAPTPGLDAPDLSAQRLDRRPDIYYLIFDRYTSAGVLAERYQHDNQPFLNSLRERGFFVAEDARANYFVTAQSLASSLNMMHITELTDAIGGGSRDWMPVFGMLAKHRVARFLKSVGYRYIHIGPKWNATARNAFADVNYPYETLSEFSMILLQTTAAYPVLFKYGVGRDDLEKFKRLNYQITLLGQFPEKEAQPFFVFAHLLIPHGPFVFNEDGTFRTPAVVAAHTEPENYLAQLVYLNTRILELVDAITGAYPVDNPPVIILQGDEGPYPKRTQPHEFDWSQATDAELNEKMRILDAIYAPGCTDSLPQRMTPVNTFRILFNCLFDTGLEMLPDRSYTYRDLTHLYDFIEVTDRLDVDSP